MKISDHIPVTHVNLDISIVRKSGEEKKQDKMCSVLQQLSSRYLTFKINILHKPLQETSVATIVMPSVEHIH